VQRPIRLNEHKGSAIRRALYRALSGSPGPRAWRSGCRAKRAKGAIYQTVATAPDAVIALSSVISAAFHASASATIRRSCMSGIAVRAAMRWAVSAVRGGVTKEGHGCA